MNKKEFLEILKDYLSKHFSDNEVSDILRDYEEYFVDGEIEGKSDIEIIQSLGSPKSIVRDLVGEMKTSKKEARNKVIDKAHDNFNKFKLSAKKQFYKGKDFVNEKLTPSLNEDKGLSTKLIKGLLVLLSTILLIPTFIFGVLMLSAGIVIVALNIVFVVLIGTSGPLFSLDKSIASLIIFVSIGAIGLDIIVCQIYLYILKLSKKLGKKYMNWVKTKKIYISAKERKDMNKGYDENISEESMLIKENKEKGDDIDE
ncbi:MAG: DUF1700 domain-containing protein [Paraclostridium sp.]